MLIMHTLPVSMSKTFFKWIQILKLYFKKYHLTVGKIWQNEILWLILEEIMLEFLMICSHVGNNVSVWIIKTKTDIHNLKIIKSAFMRY